MTTKKLASRLALRHSTRNPISIARALGITVMLVPLAGLRGMYRTIHRCPTIFINEQLDERQQLLVCAHEVGHLLLHKGLNRVFLDRHTYQVPGKYEKEAHRFSVDLLYSDEDLQECLGWPVAQVAAWMGVPFELAEYRMESVEPRFFLE